MKNSFSAIAASLLLLCSYTGTFAQNSISPQRLPLIEQQMFNDSNEAFIFVDLLIDEQIKFGPGGQLMFTGGTEFLYDNGTVYLNDKKMAEPWQSKYAKRFREFLAHATGDASGSGSFRQSCSAITQKDVLDPNSHFRKPDFNLFTDKEINKDGKEHPQKK